MRELRLARGLTLEQVGKVMGVSAQAVSQIETGRTKDVKLENFLRFCAYFEADPYYVVFGRAKGKGPPPIRKMDL